MQFNICWLYPKLLNITRLLLNLSKNHKIKFDGIIKPFVDSQFTSPGGIYFLNEGIPKGVFFLFVCFKVILDRTLLVHDGLENVSWKNAEVKAKWKVN